MSKENIGLEASKPVEEMSPQEQEKWLAENPTRGEVTQFVNGFVNNEVIPVILNSVGKELFQLRCRCDILLKYAIESGACTAEKFEKDYEAYMKEQMKKLEAEQEKQRRQAESKIIVPDKKIVH
jgi:hypothetical protein